MPVCNEHPRRLKLSPWGVAAAIFVPLALAAIGWPAPALAADPLFLAPFQVYLPDSPPAALVPYDLDGDGELDLVATSWFDGTLSVLPGLGEARFGAHQDYPTGTRPWGLALAQLDHDGKIDAVVTNSTAASVSVLRGNGDGTFQPKQDFPTGATPRGIAIADFDGNGELDLAVACDDANAVTLLEGIGDGTFVAGGTIAVGSGPYFIATGDFDHIGGIDLVVVNRLSNSLSILRGAGDGSFARTDVPVGIEPRMVSVADLDLSGTLDLAVANRGSNSVSVLFGAGDGSFGMRVDHPTAIRPRSVEAGNVNGDGNLDLLISCASAPDGITVLLGTGGGTFGSSLFGGSGTSPIATALADFDHDGRADLAVASSPGIAIHQGNGDGTFGRLNQLHLGRTFHVALGDLNHDGHLDLVSPSDDAVSVWLGDGDAHFSMFGLYPKSAITSVTLGDLDLDGDLDIVATSSFNNPLVLLGDGHGTFSSTASFGSPANAAAIGDVTGDGLPDIVCAAGGSVYVLKNTGSGPFTNVNTFFMPGGTGHVILVDLDGNGRLDIVASNEEGDQISVLVDAALPIVAYPVTRPFRLASGDFNEDGRTDIVVSVNATALAKAVLFPGVGDGTLGGPMDVPMGANPWGAAVDDYDGDGHLDLVTALLSNAVSIVLGHGDGTFGPPELFGAGFLTTTIASGDFNEDGHPDLAVANGNEGNTITLLLNTAYDITTPVRLALRTSHATSRSVHLEWFSALDGGAPARIERRDPDGPWIDVGRASFDALGALEFEDEAVDPGDRYAYRAIVVHDGDEVASDEVWVDVPRDLSFALLGADPTPAIGPVAVRFQLPRAVAATLDLWDVGGRRVLHREVGGLGAGTHSVELDTRRLKPGLYWLRLVQGPVSAARRVVVAR